MRQGKNTTSTSISFEIDVFERLVQEADAQDRSYANIINRALRDAWKMPRRKDRRPSADAQLPRKAVSR